MSLTPVVYSTDALTIVMRWKTATENRVGQSRITWKKNEWLFICLGGFWWWLVGFFWQQGCLTSGGSLTRELSFSSLYVRYTCRFVIVFSWAICLLWKRNTDSRTVPWKLSPGVCGLSTPLYSSRHWVHLQTPQHLPKASICTRTVEADAVDQRKRKDFAVCIMPRD